MLQNAYFLAKIGADTAENEQHFAEILPTDAMYAMPANALRHQHIHAQAPPMFILTQSVYLNMSNYLLAKL